MTRGIPRPNPRRSRLRGLIRRRDAPPSLPPLPLAPSLFISAGGMTERVLSSRYGARARRADRFVAGNYGTRSGRHIACRTRRGFDARIARDPPSSPLGRMSPERSHETVTWHADVTPSEHRRRGPHQIRARLAGRLAMRACLLASSRAAETGAFKRQ